MCSALAGQLSLRLIKTLEVYSVEFHSRFWSGELHLNYPNIYCELKATITCETYAPCWKSSFPGLSKSNFLVTPFSPFILIQTLALVPAKALSFVPVLTWYSEVRRIQIILTNAISKLLLSCLFIALPLAQSNSFKVHAVVYYFFSGRGGGGGGRGSGPEGYSLQWTIRGVSARNGYLLSASGNWKGGDFTSWGIWKGRKSVISVFSMT